MSSIHTFQYSVKENIRPVGMWLVLLSHHNNLILPFFHLFRPQQRFARHSRHLHQVRCVGAQGSRVPRPWACGEVYRSSLFDHCRDYCHLWFVFTLNLKFYHYLIFSLCNVGFVNATVQLNCNYFFGTSKETSNWASLHNPTPSDITVVHGKPTSSVPPTNLLFTPSVSGAGFDSDFTPLIKQ